MSNCSKCICNNCFHRQRKNCPYGLCYDDKRAVEQPYQINFVNDYRNWSDINKPMERNHWCRNGIFYPVNKCSEFVMFKGVIVKECLKANVCIYQDGYISCSLIEGYGCENCYKEFMKKEEMGVMKNEI